MTDIEQAMVILEDVPGETLLERIAKLKAWYLDMQILVGNLKADNERLKASPRILNSNRNSFM